MLLLILILFLSIIIWLIHNRYSYWRNLNIPYVSSRFPFGNLNGVGRTEHLKDRLFNYYNEYKNKYPLIGTIFFFRPVAVLLDQNLIKNCMIKDANNFNDRGAYFNKKDDPMSAHLFAIHGTEWRLLRTNLTPTFTSGKMKFMFPTVKEVSDRLELKLEEEIGKSGNDLEIKDIMARYTTDVIGSCAFGIECNTLNSKNAQFRDVALKIFDQPRWSFFFNLMLSSARNLCQKLRIKSIHDDVTEFLTNVLTETMQFRKKNNVRRNDFLDLLCELKENTKDSTNPLELKDLWAQAFVFFAAGFETSSTLLTFCLYLLAQNREIQTKARSHIEKILKKHDGQLTYEAMIEMKYLDQVLNETLRMFSPISTLFRIAENDYAVPDTNYIIPKGTLCAIPAHAIHYDNDFYPNAKEFNPENFSEENIQSRPATTFLPFGEGPRNCIGARFGMMQARLGLVAALRKFDYKLSTSSKTEYPVKTSKNHFITSPIGGLWLNIEKINSNNNN